MPPKKQMEGLAKEYVAHFFKFLGTFILIIGISLFLFSFTSGAYA
ncbi:MAG TPA: hypothetical protein VF696_00285 [Candidatus Paceibacterota bacterium]|jgi:hypothetical protein